MSLFTKSMSNVEFADISEFVALKEPEGQRVEYKEEFPKNNSDLAKGIAALANADGGLLFVGVKTDRQNRPTSIIGIASERQVGDRVVNICAANIRPQLVPDVKVLSIPGQPKRCVVFVRVARSIYAPHYLPSYDGEPLIPVRMGARSVRADIPTIEALLSRRSSNLIAGKRGEALSFSHGIPGMVENTIGRRLAKDEAFVARFVLFANGGPERLAVFNQEMDEFLREKLPFESPLGGKAGLDLRTGKPIIESGFAVSVSQDSVLFDTVGEVSGQPLCMRIRVTEKGAVQFYSLVLRKGLRISSLLGPLASAMKFAKIFYEKVGYYGEVGIDIFLENIGSQELNIGSMIFDFKAPQHVHVSQMFPVDALRDSSSDLLKMFTRRMLREGNVSLPEGVLEEISDSYLRAV